MLFFSHFWGTSQMNPWTYELGTNTFLLLVARVEILIKHLGLGINFPVRDTDPK